MVFFCFCSSSNSPESGIGLSSHSLPSSDTPDNGIGLVKGSGDPNLAEGEEDDEEFFDSEPLPILGRCKALYPFEGKWP